MTATTDATKAQAWMSETFGLTFDGYQKGLSDLDFRLHLKDAIRVFELSGLATQLAEWRSMDQKGAAGRPAVISPATALIVMMAHMQAGRGLLFTRMAMTLDNLASDDLTSIGIHKHGGDAANWYDRLWRAVQALMALVDPLPGNRHRIPSVEEYKAILAARGSTETELKQKRLDFLCERMLEASVEMVPREVRRRFKGNIAHDATFIALSGKRGNPVAGQELERPRFSINYDGGNYGRQGNHDGSNAPAGERKWGLEIEISMMVPNAPNTIATFPLLAVGVSCHRPGAIKGEGWKVFESIVKRGYPRGKCLVDRAYSNSVPAEFQGPMRKAGYELVIDYKKDDLGITDYYRDVIQVGGQWYLNFMPDDLIYAKTQHLSTLAALESRTAQTGAQRTLRRQTVADADALLATRLASRDHYRLTRKGLPDADGFQRYSYPDPDGYLAVDKITGEILPPITTKSLTIPLAAGLKHAQLFPHGTEKWTAWYGLRSIIEGFNSYIKEPAHEDIESAGRRRARGNTFAYLASTMALVSANLRKIYSFLQNAASKKPLTAKTRARRRPGTDPSVRLSLSRAQDQPPPQ